MATLSDRIGLVLKWIDLIRHAEEDEPLNALVEAERADSDQREMGRRERNKLAKQSRIIAAARELFRAQGYTETTTSQIAEVADVGTGTLFLYVRSKEDLLVLVFRDEMIAAARQLFATLPEKSAPVDQMMSVFEGMYDYHGQDPEVSRILMREVTIPSSTERAADLDELLDVVFGGLEEIAAKAGPRASKTPGLTARSAFAIYLHSLVSWLGGAEDRSEALSILRRQLDILIGEESSGG